MTMENEKIPHETPEVLPLSATFTPQTLAIASLGVAVLLLACTI
jgi:signal recognition particle receptor subunit beta